MCNLAGFWGQLSPADNRSINFITCPRSYCCGALDTVCTRYGGTPPLRFLAHSTLFRMLLQIPARTSEWACCAASAPKVHHCKSPSSASIANSISIWLENVAGYTETFGSTACRLDDDCDDLIWFFPMVHWIIGSPSTRGLVLVLIRLLLRSRSL